MIYNNSARRLLGALAWAGILIGGTLSVFAAIWLDEANPGERIVVEQTLLNFGNGIFSFGALSALAYVLAKAFAYDTTFRAAEAQGLKSPAPEDPTVEPGLVS
ncbi:hypothetical protein EYE40_05330 [Glaciihabitans arcticus]|uniref:Uncharacterized protein n=1 Tax=Glaciihabitans arcticus TaxID=2668039 RepID=A0A4V2JET9_9MICO|nr:hypothetical protein [Glaciihabitans arcticus]TBN56869.1 hypothetical protein EYE40_05330 [Glaciihabitans arcticus]